MNGFEHMAVVYAEMEELTRPRPLEPRRRVEAPCTTCQSTLVAGRPRDLGPAVARLVARNGGGALLCQSCLNHWFDNAADDESLEPASWAWLDGHGPSRDGVTDEALAAALTDPRNREQASLVLRYEARVNPGWIRDLLRREQRAGRTVIQ